MIKQSIKKITLHVEGIQSCHYTEHLIKHRLILHQPFPYSCSRFSSISSFFCSSCCFLSSSSCCCSSLACCFFLKSDQETGGGFFTFSANSVRFLSTDLSALDVVGCVDCNANQSTCYSYLKRIPVCTSYSFLWYCPTCALLLPLEEPWHQGVIPCQY